MDTFARLDILFYEVGLRLTPVRILFERLLRTDPQDFARARHLKAQIGDVTRSVASLWLEIAKQTGVGDGTRQIGEGHIEAGHVGK